MRSGSPKKVFRGSSPQPTDWLLPESIVSGPIDLAGIFGNSLPVELEIGTGKGTFLAARAAARPEVNFIGLEWARTYCHYAADRMQRNGLTNVRMLKADAGPFVKNCLADASLIRAHIYFPDPWPKKRHHIRRLIQPNFVNNLWRKLTPGGELLIVTDHMDYFEHIRRVFTAVKGWATIPFPQMADQDGEVVGTNFERKYIAQGRSFYKLARLKYIG